MTRINNTKVQFYLGRNLTRSINYFRNSWKSNGVCLSLQGPYKTKQNLYTDACKHAYGPSVKVRLPLFNGLSFSIRVKLRDHSVNYLTNQLIKLFNMSTMNFQKFANWEYKTASYIRELYQKNGVSNYTFGNAQKLINLAIKYILSYQCTPYQHDVFKYGFFPIDRIIQTKLKKQFGVGYLYKSSTIPSWAKCDNWFEILDYQKRARNEIMKNNFYSPILWEVTNW